jgi:hypothetical protein
MGNYPLSGELLEAMPREDAEKIEKALSLLGETAASNGYTSVSSLEELGLTSEQMQQFQYLDEKRRDANERYYRADRDDGTQVKVVARPILTGRYEAEFFSPAHYQGHRSNHDFSIHEMDGTFKFSLTGQARKENAE